MSRIGKQPVILPEGVSAKLENGVLNVKGPKGSLETELHGFVRVKITDSEVLVTVQNPKDKNQSALWGLFRNLIQNMVLGVTQGFTKELEINGVGYKAAVTGSNLVLNVGYSHPKEFHIPEGIEIVVNKNIITISGIDKQKVGQIAAEIRKIRPVEPYKGKGIKYIDEQVRRKVGKAASKAE